MLSNKASGSGIKMAVYQSLLRVPESPCIAEFKGHFKQVLEKAKAAAAAESILPALLIHRNRKSLGSYPLLLDMRCVCCVVIVPDPSPPGSLLELLHAHLQSEVLTSDKFVHSASHTGRVWLPGQPVHCCWFSMMWVSSDTRCVLLRQCWWHWLS